jgi:hypothetical protein
VSVNRNGYEGSIPFTRSKFSSVKGWCAIQGSNL